MVGGIKDDIIYEDDDIQMYVFSTPKKKEHSIEGTTCNITMKVNLSKEPYLFIVYAGRFFMVPHTKCAYHKDHPLIKNEYLYRCSLMFDETGKVYKNVNNTAQFIQDLVDKQGNNHLLKSTHNYLNKELFEIYPILNSHYLSAEDYVTYKEYLEKFNKVNNNVSS